MQNIAQVHTRRVMETDNCAATSNCLANPALDPLRHMFDIPTVLKQCQRTLEARIARVLATRPRLW